MIVGHACGLAVSKTSQRSEKTKQGKKEHKKKQKNHHIPSHGLCETPAGNVGFARYRPLRTDQPKLVICGMSLSVSDETCRLDSFAQRLLDDLPNGCGPGLILRRLAAGHPPWSQIRDYPEVANLADPVSPRMEKGLKRAWPDIEIKRAPRSGRNVLYLISLTANGSKPGLVGHLACNQCGCNRAPMPLSNEHSHCLPGAHEPAGTRREGGVLEYLDRRWWTVREDARSSRFGGWALDVSQIRVPTKGTSLK